MEWGWTGRLRGIRRAVGFEWKGHGKRVTVDARIRIKKTREERLNGRRETIWGLFCGVTSWRPRFGLSQTGTPKGKVGVSALVG